MIGPASTIPRPPPTPRSAEIRAMPVGTRSLGNSSRMIANASGKIAPPAPWITRPRMSTSIEVASAATSVPAATIASVTTSIRLFPNMSPSRPTIGVATEAESR